MKRYIFGGFLVLMLVLVATFPARVAYQWFAPPDLQLTGIGGSIWSGTATEGLAGGAYIRDISWRFKPGAILGGKLAFSTTSRPASGTMNTDVAVGLDGSLTLSALSGSVPLDLAHPAFQQNGISGDLSLAFDTLVMKNGLPVDVSGSVLVANVYVPDLSAGVLGDFRADFQTVDGTVTGTVDDVSGVLDVDAVITLAPDRSYSLVGDVAARPAAPPSIEQQLRFLGTPDQRGMRPFRFEGSL
jgi:general secretion pathway protein N